MLLACQLPELLSYWLFFIPNLCFHSWPLAKSSFDSWQNLKVLLSRDTKSLN